MFGDLFQLPPVVDSDELMAFFRLQHGGPYFFKRFRPKRVLLLKNYRQRDEEFLRLLWKVRTGTADEADIAALNQRVIPVADSDERFVYLTSTNAAAQKRNAQFLDQIKSERRTYMATIRGRFAESVAPGDSLLELKVGAKIMMVKNDHAGRWVNGTVGKVATLGQNSVSVEIDGNVWAVERETWEQVRYVYNSQARCFGDITVHGNSISACR